MATDTVVHEGRRVFAQGKGAWRVIAELYLSFGVAGGILTLTLDAPFGVALGIAGGMATLMALWILLVSRGRVQITSREVRVRSWHGTTVVPREQIAEAVHIKDLVVIGTIKGYVALLDASGAPLWRSASNLWSPQAVRALTKAGGRGSTVGQLTPEQVSQRWPRMLPWSLAHPRQAFWLTVVASIAVLGIFGLFFSWLFTGPLA